MVAARGAGGSSIFTSRMIAHRSVKIRDASIRNSERDAGAGNRHCES
jgi:hypothetical protein